MNECLSTRVTHNEQATPHSDPFTPHSPAFNYHPPKCCLTHVLEKQQDLFKDIAEMCSQKGSKSCCIGIHPQTVLLWHSENRNPLFAEWNLLWILHTNT